MVIVALAATASADTVTVTGLDNDGNAIGQYVIGGQTYWWLCIEPGPPALSNQTITAQTYSFQDGWDKQNTERYYNIYQTDPTLYTDVIPKQVTVMEYVLDTYLPWSTLAGASGRFLEQDPSFTSFNNNDAFHNAMFAVQNFLSETEGKAVKSDFTNMSDYMDYYMGLGDATDDARSSIFQSILSDVASKDAAGFFNTYTAQHDYFTLNTFYAENDPNNWQDGLVIGGFAPVPEPGGALLIGCFGMAWMLRRRRSVAA
ncbi:hypothetical protein [Prosthecobacter sp.]|uniref:hypothetical protein n=1 Tax=Prosthecobacter sp. TaxID=1965333 RepID=UPI003783FF32